MQVIKILDRPIAFHRCFVVITGSVNAALLLSQAVYWSNRTSDPHGWFHKTREEWEEETGLSRHEQDNARKKLCATGFWEEDLRGSPATVHFRVDAEKLQKALEGADFSLPESGKPDCRKVAIRIAGKRQTELPETGKPVSRKVANLMAEKPQTLLIETETTTETTAESKRAPGVPSEPFTPEGQPPVTADLTPNLSPLEFALCRAVGWLPDSLNSTKYSRLKRASSELASHPDATPERVQQSPAFYQSQGKYSFGVEWIANDWGLISAWISAQSSPVSAAADNSRTAQRQKASAEARQIILGGGNKR